MDSKLKNELARKLRGQREMLFKEIADSETDLSFIAEDRESELEEQAQEELMARLLDRLSDRGKRQLEEIDAALERLADRAYGVCLGCRKPISSDRLRVLPATRLCVRCAAAREKKSPMAEAKEETTHPGRFPGDLSILSDLELQALILEELREDGRVDLDELRVVCRHGVLYLDGALPSEAEHSILLQILKDVVGIDEIVDRIQIEGLLWEREDRFKAEEPEETAPWAELYGTGGSEIVESDEERMDTIQPVHPTPEKD